MSRGVHRRGSGGVGFGEKTYSRKHCPAALIDTPDYSTNRFRETEALYRIASEKVRTKTWAEFGVGGGASAKQLAKLLDVDGTLYLFDSWQGIPDEWVLGPSQRHGPGSWKFPRLRSFDERLVITDGWFDESLPYEFPEQLGLVNIDCDVYSSTRTVLFRCDPWLQDGTLLIFDELLGYANFRDHEYRAVGEWMDATGKSIEWLGKERFAALGVVREAA